MVCPKFFNHKWESRNRGQTYDLHIEIPRNVRQVLENPESTIPSQESYERSLKTDLLTNRRETFESLLRLNVNKEFEKQRSEQYPLLSQDLKFNAFDQTSKCWPSFFDIQRVEPVAKSDLCEMPKCRKGETLGDFLNKHTIRQSTQSNHTSYHCS